MDTPPDPLPDVVDPPLAPLPLLDVVPPPPAPPKQSPMSTPAACTIGSFSGAGPSNTPRSFPVAPAAITSVCRVTHVSAATAPATTSARSSAPGPQKNAAGSSPFKIGRAHV